jgi:prophage antirepressor-like protein
MEIFNDILKINNTEICIIYDDYNNIWFGLIDVIKSLDYKNYEKARKNLKINKTNIKIYSKIKRGTLEGPPSTKQPNKKFINESGLYELLSISTKPYAKLFMNKYFTEIMPKIRETGKFILNNEDKKELDKINEKLKSIKKSNKDLLNNIRNIIYPIGSALYVIKKRKNNKTYYKLGYTKNLNKRLKVYNTSELDRIFFNYFIILKDKNIDSCVKKIMKNEEYIKNKEFYTNSLKSVLTLINKCDSRLNKISCGYCLKSYIFENIKLHKCKNQ